MIKNILLLSIVLLFTITIVSANAQSPGSITTDKEIYYYGDDIIFTIQFGEPLSGIAQMYAIGTVSESVMIAGHTIRAGDLDENLSYTFTHPTDALDVIRHSVMPNDGWFTGHVQYSIYDPDTGYRPGHLSTMFLFKEDNYDRTERFEANEQAILDLQNNGASPEVLSRIDALETEVATIQPLKTTIADLQMQVTTLVADLSTLESQQVLTNAELNTSITDLQTANQTQSDQIDAVKTDVTQLQTEVTAIVAENATPQDAEQNLRMDGIEDNLQTVNATLSNSVNLLRNDYTQTKDSTNQVINANMIRLGNNEQGVFDNKEALFQLQPVVDENESNITDLQSTNSTIFNTLEGLAQTDIDNLDRHISDSDILNFQVVDLSNREETNSDNIELLWTDTNANTNSILTLDNRMGANEVLGLKLLNDVNGGKSMHTQLLNLGNSNLDRIEGLDSDMSDVQMTNNRQGGDIATLQSQMSTIGTTSSPHDDTQNVRLTDVENELRFLGVEVYDRVYPRVFTLESQVTGILQSIDGFIQEHIDMWAEIDRKANILDAP